MESDISLKNVLYTMVNNKKYLVGELPNVGYAVCATNQGQFFTFKNPEQTPNLELFSGTSQGGIILNRPIILDL